MTGRSCWVGASARADIGARALLAGSDAAGPFDGAPLALEIIPDAARRTPQVALRRCLEVLMPGVGSSLSTVDLLLVFAGSFATAFARRLVVAVEESRRVRPTDSTGMETSETVRAALVALDAGRPRSAVIVASDFDPVLASAVTSACSSALVVRFELYGPEPEDCDVWATHVASPRAGGGGS